ncbi:MAG: GNAT family N-acetyltransferase [Alphaproteobacteria bacterium]|nr:GNAT family N-acetyltransferase [Alphaproteobacteria bacterium]MBV9553306.1 GNAT family N-acetyltransferase [Alphaproteobacteria bacterium]
MSVDWLAWAELGQDRLYELLRFRQAVFVVEQASPYADLDGRDARAQHLLVRRGDALVGYLRLIEPDPLVRIGRVAVAAEERGRGLARAMMDAALQRAREVYPHRDVALSAQTHLQPFYESLGFVATSVPYDDCGVPHVDMIGPPREV